ncbi:flagellar hook-associated protein FlgK [bacterium]|nr:flagellar hook-associated protein FlgK [bacterium]
MALSLALNNALSSLRVNQSALNVLSQNISNANTPGYSRQNLQLESQYVNNSGAGVKIADVTRNVDQYLQRTTQMQASITMDSSVISDYMDRVQLVTGKPASDNSLNAYIDNYFSAMQDLADSPDKASLRENAVKTASTLARSMNDTAYGLEQLRYEAELDISREVKTINDTLTKLYDVNIAIANADALKQTKVGLYDQRDALVNQLSQSLDIRVRYLKDGRATVAAAGGIGLVDYQLHQLQYTPASGVDTFINDGTLGPITSTAVDRKTFKPLAPPATLVAASTEGSFSTPMKSGKLYGLLQVRNVKIPEILNTLDTLAQGVREKINAIHNDGAGFPPPDTLTGQVAVDPQEVRNWQGSALIGIVNPDGTPLDNPYPINDPLSQETGGFRPAQLNLNFNSGEGDVGWHTGQTIADEMNAYLGPQGAKWELGNLSNVRLVSNIENVPQTGALSLDFDFENISDNTATVQILGATINGFPAAGVPTTAYNVNAGFTGRTGTEWGITGTGVVGPNTIDVTIQVTDANGNVSTDTLTFVVDNSVPGEIKNNRFIATTSGGGNAYQVLPSDPSAIARAEFVNDKGLPVQPGEYGYLKINTFDPDHRIAMSEGTSYDNGRLFATPPEVGTGKGISHYFGLNNFFNENNNFVKNTPYLGNDTFKNSALNLSIRTDIIDHSNYLSTGKLTQTHLGSVGGKPVYTYELGAGGKQAVQAMADLGLAQASFAESGLLPVTDQTLSGYSSSFLGATAAVAEFAKQQYDNDNLLYQTYQSKSDAISGVNLDEEVGNTIIYQNAYSASARVITVVNSMFDALMNSF